jgi:hypothetical protein
MNDQARGETPTSGGGGATGGTSGPDGTGPGGGWRSATVGGQWPTQVADTIEGVVSAFRLQVIRPLMLVARGLVFGIVVGTMALIVSVLLSVALVRVLTVYVFGGRVWASYLLLGFLFSLAGVVAWSQRHSDAEESAEAA